MAWLPALLMTMIQIGFAGMNLLSKMAMNTGMNPFVHVAYRQIFAALIMCPIAYFRERNTRPTMTRSTFFKIFMCSIFGGSTNQITYIVGLQYCNPTVASALTNLMPAFTFLLVVISGHERVKFTNVGIAKVLGTLISIGGAVILSVYHGSVVPIGQPKINWKLLEDITHNKSNTCTNNKYLGPLLVMVSALSWSIWSIIQAQVNREYAATYSSTALMCFMASCICLVIGFCVDHDQSDWSLMSSGVRVISATYSGVFCSALSYFVMSWCIRRKGPFFVSIFNPLPIIIVSVLSWLLLGEKIYTGTIIGSTLIILGLLMVLWGNWVESEQERALINSGSKKEMAVENLESQQENLNNSKI
ncbi:WAT1-related protein At1g09380-like [Lycium ferocissimum]|uniref:WAT1-related protein At1g09380-like n=1 Tax=Lycium ferocissimum TaxID=112874 RepID=UPI0028168096|nr:WAT1-related protein At1g09380-like [Lycium ferocissimum]